MDRDAKGCDLIPDRPNVRERNDDVLHPRGIGAGDQLVEHHLRTTGIKPGDEMKDSNHSEEQSSWSAQHSWIRDSPAGRLNRPHHHLQRCPTTLRREPESQFLTLSRPQLNGSARTSSMK